MNEHRPLILTGKQSKFDIFSGTITVKWTANQNWTREGGYRKNKRKQEDSADQKINKK